MRRHRMLYLLMPLRVVIGWTGSSEHSGRPPCLGTSKCYRVPMPLDARRPSFRLEPQFSPQFRRKLLLKRNRDRCSSVPLSEWARQSSFYDDFEKFDFDDDEDEEDEDGDDDSALDGATLAEFRSKMDFLFDGGAGGAADSSRSSSSSAVDELIDYARGRQSGGSAGAPEDPSWATVATKLEDGVVLLANPAKFCADVGSVTPNPSLLAKFGLTMPPPAELGPDRRADLLPVLILVETPSSSTGSGSARRSIARMRGVLLNRRTGYLLGDLEQPGGEGGGGDPSSGSPPRPLLEKFCIQPLWFGGVDNVSSGLDMLHQCPAVIGCKALTKDGLYWGGDPSQAQTAMEETTERVLTGFDFKFFVQSTVWTPGELEKQVENKIWFMASVSKDVLFKPRDRMGTRRAKPLWTECMELLGGEYKQCRDQLYNENEGSG